MPRPPGDKRDVILASALRAFLERGYDGSTVSHVADYARIAPATIYLYFENKQGLLNELYRGWKEALIVATRIEHASEEDPASLFAEFWGKLLSFGRDHPNAYVFLVLTQHSKHLDAENQGLDSVFFAPVESVLNRMRESKLLRPVPLTVATGIIRGTADKLIGEVKEGNLRLDDDLVRESAQMCWAALTTEVGRWAGSTTATD